jgi:surface polysaccharide O-acyltransferase-like enzyme
MIKHGQSATPAGPSDSLQLDVPRILPARVLRRAEPTPALVSLPLERVAGVDLLRIMAAVGIIWFHMEGAPHRGIGYAGLPVFLLIFFSLVTRQSPARTTVEFVSRRWQRLLKPWLFWSLVYGSCQLAKAAATADWHPLHEILSVKTLFIGTWVHLWYLPYAFVLGLLLHVLNQRISAVNPDAQRRCGPDAQPDRTAALRAWGGHVAVVVTATVVGVVTLAACAAHLAGRALTPPLPQWEFGLATIPLGLAVGRSLAVPSRRAQAWLLLMIAGATVGVSALLTSLGFRSMAVPYSLAVVLVCLAYLWPVRSNAFISAVAPLTFGIYLIHPLVIYGLEHSLTRSGAAGVLANGHYGVAIILTTCLAGAVTWGLTKTPLRWVV